jgi:hypothetical protein
VAERSLGRDGARSVMKSCVAEPAPSRGAPPTVRTDWVSGNPQVECSSSGDSPKGDVIRRLSEGRRYQETLANSDVTLSAI